MHLWPFSKEQPAEDAEDDEDAGVARARELRAKTEQLADQLADQLDSYANQLERVLQQRDRKEKT